MLAPPRHSRTPACTRCTGCCALAPAKAATSVVTTTPAKAKVIERRMGNLQLKRCDASKESAERHAPGARLSMTQHRRPCQIWDAFGLVIPGWSEGPDLRCAI